MSGRSFNGYAILVRPLAARKHVDEDKLIDVTRKTLAKMSPAAIDHARGMTLAPDARSLLERALET